MTFSPASLIAIAPQLGLYLKQAVDHYAMLRSSGKEVSVEIVTMFLSGKMADWSPEIAGVSLLDDETRHAAARFLSGVAVNIARA